ncbi:neurofilament heavy polypeptide-like [Quercus lobata]|uniref:neurofilament heavy polypeptide-like n=1 Tax=Quercus lobata TaxID=97700 RepID=UPI00124853C7|nr:neurofilament heavy polypeptide-like [Quercus lobata]
MLNGEPLMDNASIKDFQGSTGCYEVETLEQALLLPSDMIELRAIRRHEVFLNLKRYLGMAVQATFRAKEIADNCHRQMKEEEGRRNAAVDSFRVVERSAKELKEKLTRGEELRRSVESTLKDSSLQKKLAEVQQLKDQAERSQGEVEKAKEEAKKARDEAKQHGYDIGVAKTEEALRVELRKPENIYYPPANQASDPLPQGEAAPTPADFTEEAQPQDLPPPGHQEQVEGLTTSKEVSSEVQKSSDELREVSKDGAASHDFELVLASVTVPVQEAPKDKEEATSVAATTQAGKTSKDKLHIKLKP